MKLKITECLGKNFERGIGGQRKKAIKAGTETVTRAAGTRKTHGSSISSAEVVLAVRSLPSPPSLSFLGFFIVKACF